MKQFFLQRWFLLALAIVLAVGITQASRLEPLLHFRGLRDGLVAGVLFIMALPLEAQAMWRSLRWPGPPLLAIAINLGLLPLVAWGISFALSREMAGGLYVAAATPCTLASAAVWTRRAGGNDSVAVMVTVITNLSCFILTPLWLVAMTGLRTRSEQLDLGNMITKLALLVVLPMAFAQFIRLGRPVGQWATRQKIPLGVVAQCGILSMVLFGAIQTGLKLNDQSGASPNWPDFLAMVVAVVGIHLAMLGTGMWLAWLVRFAREDRIAVGIAGSQKTLMVGLQVGMELGLSILPMVVYHISQLLLDTLIADRLRKQGETGEGRDVIDLI